VQESKSAQGPETQTPVLIAAALALVFTGGSIVRSYAPWKIFEAFSPCVMQPRGPCASGQLPDFGPAPPSARLRRPGLMMVPRFFVDTD
jgi:hypothetical protein